MKPGKRGFKRLISAARYSFQGLAFCWNNEAAFRQEVKASIFLIPLAVWLGEGGSEKALLVSTCLLVMVVEILNTAIEAIVDRIGEEHHLLSGSAKDLGSAAVMISLILFTVVWALVLIF